MNATSSLLRSLSALRSPGPGWRRQVLPSAVFLGLGVLLGAGAHAGAAPAPAYDIANSVKTFALDATEKTPAGYQYWFFDKDFARGRSIKLSVVRPHLATHPPHRHEGHEFFFVLQGQAEFFLEGKTRVVGPRTALYCPPNLLHGISNAGEEELQYLVIKDYPWSPAQ
jgi:mannose-6-phosphate isomerase-like protein (cupin superfamily)